MFSVGPFFRSRSLIAATISLFSICANAEGCDYLKLNSQVDDGSLYYRPDGAADWAQLLQPEVDLGSRHVSFSYVISEAFDDERSGVVVLKSGRIRQADEVQKTRKTKVVELARRNEGFINKQCKALSFPDQTVSSQSYDDYHDLGGADQVLDAFHIQYLARKNACKRTNNDAPDSLFPWDPRSNRGQFSFDTRVVDSGTYIQAFTFTGITTAYASSENLENQRVEIKQYQVKKGIPTCIKFDMRVNGRAAFLRINDLESLAPGSFLRLARSRENRWTISP